MKNVNLFFSTDETVKKQAHIIARNDDYFAGIGVECEVISMSEKFILAKYKDLYLSGYVTNLEKDRIDYTLDIINFDEIFPKTRKYKYYKHEPKNTTIYAHLPKEIEVRFDLKKVYQEMIDGKITEANKGDIENEIIKIGDFE